MKTRLLNKWFVGLTVGLLLAVSALGWAGPPWGKGGIPAALKACEAELASCLEQQGFTFPGDGQTGAELSYTDNGDGTFTDDNTGLMWEIKLAQDDPACAAANQMDRDVHCVNNLFTWTDVDGADSDYSSADGTAFTEFLAELNGELTGEPFASHDDWRLPTVKELQSLVDYSVRGPAVSVDLPGPTADGDYLSSASHADNDTSVWASVWCVYFFNGSVSPTLKADVKLVRAVRGGW